MSGRRDCPRTWRIIADAFAAAGRTDDAAEALREMQVLAPWK